MIASQHRREAMLEALGAPAECGQVTSLDGSFSHTASRSFWILGSLTPSWRIHDSVSSVAPSST